MSLNSTPSAQRVRISFFGRRNAGKSSLVNAVTGQWLSVVSEVKGTTTDPVSKAMELLPLGPVLITDTPGFDDESALGALRIRKTRQVLDKTDIAVLTVDGTLGLTTPDRELLEEFAAKKLPHLVVYTKQDLGGAVNDDGEEALLVSAKTGAGIAQLKERLGHLCPQEEPKCLVADLLRPGDIVVLVIPIDESAPKGRLILPQQQVLREALDAAAMAVVVQETELAAALKTLGKPPALVITDSQVFAAVSGIVPENIPLTSFSILMARYKGFLDTAVQGISALDRLRPGDKLLIAEGCTHHRQCNDIGTVKLPRWIKAHRGHAVAIETCSGTEFPVDVSDYALVLHCGGCMLNERELQSRKERATEQGVPFTNYGTAIAHMTGILARSLAVFD